MTAVHLRSPGHLLPPMAVKLPRATATEVVEALGAGTIVVTVAAEVAVGVIQHKGSSGGQWAE